MLRLNDTHLMFSKIEEKTYFLSVKTEGIFREKGIGERKPVTKT